MPKPTKGVLRAENGRYYLDTGKTRKELPPGVEQRAIESLIDQEVEVYYSNPIRYVVAIRGLDVMPAFPKCFLCYIPPDDPWKQVVNEADQVVRSRLVAKFFKMGIIDEVTRDRLAERNR